jgi:hypothetical protein
MKKTDVISKNQSLYCFVLRLFEIEKPLFTQAVKESIFKPTSYSIMYGPHSGNIHTGNIIIDGTKIKGEEYQNNFFRAVNSGILNQMSMDTHCFIPKELITEITFVAEIYRFKFRVSKYKEDSEHEFKLVKNLKEIPHKVKIRHFVDLTISVIGN